MSYFSTDSLAVSLTLIVLLVFSIVTWMLIVSRFWSNLRSGKLDAAFRKAFWAAKDLHEGEAVARAHKGDLAKLTLSGFEALAQNREVSLSLDSLGDRKDILERTLRSELQQLQHRKEYGLMALASIGSTAPFVGLFGTVWGIMRAFTSIAAAQNSSLAVVAPGIAEALFATAIGLFAAIPAVIAYNRFSHGINRMESRLNRFADGFYATLSRELEAQR
jgi:biopolymer transport protein TolQ